MPIILKDIMPRLSAAGIGLNDDFHALTGLQVDALVECARLAEYRKPKDANGSTARYFFAAVQRLAGRNAPKIVPVTVVSVHRFGDKVAVYVGDGQTTYLSPKQAEKLAAALRKCATSVKTCKFVDSSFGTVEINQE